MLVLQGPMVLSFLGGVHLDICKICKEKSFHFWEYPIFSIFKMASSVKYSIRYWPGVGGGGWGQGWELLYYIYTQILNHRPISDSLKLEKRRGDIFSSEQYGNLYFRLYANKIFSFPVIFTEFHF